MLSVLLGMGFAALAQTKIELKYAPSVPAVQSERLNQDILLLDTLPLKDEDGEFKRLFKLDQVDNESAKHWLAERAHIIVDENYPVNTDSIVPLAPGITYPFPTKDDTANMTGVLKDETIDDDGKTNAAGVIVIMSNIGSSIYGFGKHVGMLIGFDWQGGNGDPVPVTSPHVGVFRIGQGLFLPISEKMPADSINNRLHSIYRLGVLFHESRHGDGHGETLAFAHIKCPAGHDLEGAYACDTPSNGAYRMGELFLRAAKAGCTDCTGTEKTVLDMMIADSDSRIMSPLKAVAATSDKPATTNLLCDTFQKMGVQADFCKDESGPKEVVEWDDEPESL